MSLLSSRARILAIDIQLIFWDAPAWYTEDLTWRYSRAYQEWIFKLKRGLLSVDQTNKVRYISIDSDDWQDVGKIYKVIKSTSRLNSTAVELTIEHESGQQEKRVVPNQWIDWRSQ